MHYRLVARMAACSTYASAIFMIHTWYLGPLLSSLPQASSGRPASVRLMKVGGAGRGVAHVMLNTILKA
jgi:hypothetical protein